MGNDIRFLGNGRALQLLKAKRIVEWGLHLFRFCSSLRENSVQCYQFGRPLGCLNSGIVSVEIAKFGKDL